MHDYLFPIEVVRFAFVAGVVVSMYLYERRHLTTGSIVVPGYIAVFLIMPSIIVATAINATLTYLLVNRVLSRWFLLYGRTRFTILVLISIVIQTAMLKLSPHGPWLWESDVPWFVGVGYVVPALIAHDMGRQGIGKTAKAVLLAAGIVAVPIALALWLRLPGINTLDPLRALGHTHLPPQWMPVAVLFSASAAWAIAKNYDLRSGGFVGAALVATFAVNPWQVLLLTGVAICTHQLVTRVLMTQMILFGRRKFAAMLLLASVIMWITVRVGESFLNAQLQWHVGIASLALTPMFLPGLIANDMQRSSVRRTLQGVVLASVFVLAATRSLEMLLGNEPPSAPTVLAALALTSVIFFPQLRLIAGTLVASAQRASLVVASAHRASLVEADEVNQRAIVPPPLLVEPEAPRQTSSSGSEPTRRPVHDAPPPRRIIGRSAENYRPRHLMTNPHPGTSQHSFVRRGKSSRRGTSAAPDADSPQG